MPDKELKVTIGADTDPLTKGVKDAAATLDALEEHKVEIPITLDEGSLDKAKASLKDTAGSIDKVGASAGASKSVLANMVGNATQDLGALGGVAGSAGVAIGQMAERIADAASAGEKIGSVAGSFLKVAGPIALLSVGVAAVTEIFAKWNREAAAAKKRAEEWASALVKAKGDVDQAFRDKSFEKWTNDQVKALDRLGLVASDVGDALQGSVTPAMARVKTVIEQATARMDGFADGSANANARLGDMAKGLGYASGDAFWKTVKEAKGLLDDEADGLKTGTEILAERTRVFGLATQAERDHAANMGATQAALDAGEQAWKDYTLSVAAADQALKDQQATQRGAVDSGFALATAMDTAATAFDTAKGATDDSKTSMNEKEAADRNAEAAIGAVAAAAVKYGEDVAAARGETQTAEQAVNAQKTALQALKEKFPQLTPVIDDYLLKLAAIPTNIPTDVTVVVHDAALDDFIRKLQMVDTTDWAAQVQAGVSGLSVGPTHPGTSTPTPHAGARTAGGSSSAPGMSSSWGGDGAAIGGVTTNIVVQAGFGTDVFAVATAVLNASRQATRLASGALRNTTNRRAGI